MNNENTDKANISISQRDELTEAASAWRMAGSYKTNPYMKRVCERTAQALEIERDTGVAVCSCCHKPLSERCCDDRGAEV